VAGDRNRPLGLILDWKIMMIDNVKIGLGEIEYEHVNRTELGLNALQ
jgi:hypothetical protein